jgi:hypothetical protein
VNRVDSPFFHEDTAEDNSRLVFAVIVLILLLGVLVTGVFGWIVRNNVLANANRTDLDMRAVAWASVAFACGHDGRFPIDEAELFSVEPLPDAIGCVPSAGENWPVTREDALRGEPAPSLAAALERLDVVFSSDGALAPLVGNGGLPTLNDPPTKDTIREWLKTFSIQSETKVDP